MQEYGTQQHRVEDHNMVYSQGRDPNGIIMVESNPHGAYKQQQQQMQSENAAATTSNGKKKKNKKNKNKIGDDASNKSNQMQSMGGNASGGDRMVSLLKLDLLCEVAKGDKNGIF
jgi:hypothetical protein